jgi:hypothetical protein
MALESLLASALICLLVGARSPLVVVGAVMLFAALNYTCMCFALFAFTFLGNPQALMLLLPASAVRPVLSKRFHELILE